jgi:hypothetical protein
MEPPPTAPDAHRTDTLHRSGVALTRRILDYPRPDVTRAEKTIRLREANNGFTNWTLGWLGVATSAAAWKADTLALRAG